MIGVQTCTYVYFIILTGKFLFNAFYYWSCVSLQFLFAANNCMPMKTTKHCQATWRQKALEFELCIQDRVDLDGWFQEVRSAHLVLLVAFAGMQPLEVFCTSYSLMVFSNRFDGNKVCPMTAAFSLQEYSLQQQNHQSHSSNSQSSLNKRESWQCTSWNHPSWSTRFWMHSSNSTTFWRHAAWQCIAAHL